ESAALLPNTAPSEVSLCSLRATQPLVGDDRKLAGAQRGVTVSQGLCARSGDLRGRTVASGVGGCQAMFKSNAVGRRSSVSPKILDCTQCSCNMGDWRNGIASDYESGLLSGD
ncbi:unnamed protein product, partial [Mycena citricolor]